MIRNDKLCQIMDQRQNNQVKNLTHSMIRDRQENQRFQDRLEFDLNDPQSKLKDHPARIGDEDPRLTVSGMQRYVYLFIIVLIKFYFNSIEGIEMNVTPLLALARDTTAVLEEIVPAVYTIFISCSSSPFRVNILI